MRCRIRVTSLRLPHTNNEVCSNDEASHRDRLNVTTLKELASVDDDGVRARGEPVAEARAALDRPVLGGYLDGSGAACGRDALTKHLCSPNVKVNVLNVSAGGAR